MAGNEYQFVHRLGGQPPSSGYARQMSKQQWNQHKAKIIELHRHKSTHSVIQQTLARELDVHVTLPQLRRKLTQWGLGVYKTDRTHTDQRVEALQERTPSPQADRSKAEEQSAEVNPTDLGLSMPKDPSSTEPCAIFQDSPHLRCSEKNGCAAQEIGQKMPVTVNGEDDFLDDMDFEAIRRSSDPYDTVMLELKHHADTLFSTGAFGAAFATYQSLVDNLLTSYPDWSPPTAALLFNSFVNAARLASRVNHTWVVHPSLDRALLLYHPIWLSDALHILYKLYHFYVDDFDDPGFLSALLELLSGTVETLELLKNLPNTQQTPACLYRQSLQQDWTSQDTFTGELFDGGHKLLSNVRTAIHRITPFLVWAIDYILSEQMMDQDEMTVEYERLATDFDLLDTTSGTNPRAAPRRQAYCDLLLKALDTHVTFWRLFLPTTAGHLKLVVTEIINLVTDILYPDTSPFDCKIGFQQSQRLWMFMLLSDKEWLKTACLTSLDKLFSPDIKTASTVAGTQYKVPRVFPHESKLNTLLSSQDGSRRRTSHPGNVSRFECHQRLKKLIQEDDVDLAQFPEVEALSRNAAGPLLLEDPEATELQTKRPAIPTKEHHSISSIALAPSLNSSRSSGYRSLVQMARRLHGYNTYNPSPMSVTMSHGFPPSSQSSW